MNNNTKSRLGSIKPGQTKTFSIPHKVQGNHGGEYSTRSQTITRIQQDRISKRPKVAGGRA